MDRRRAVGTAACYRRDRRAHYGAARGGAAVVQWPQWHHSGNHRVREDISIARSAVAGGGAVARAGGAGVARGGALRIAGGALRLPDRHRQHRTSTGALARAHAASAGGHSRPPGAVGGGAARAPTGTGAARHDRRRRSDRCLEGVHAADTRRLLEWARDSGRAPSGTANAATASVSVVRATGECSWSGDSSAVAAPLLHARAEPPPPRPHPATDLCGIAAAPVGHRPGAGHTGADGAGQDAPPGDDQSGGGADHCVCHRSAHGQRVCACAGSARGVRGGHLGRAGHGRPGRRQARARRCHGRVSERRHSGAGDHRTGGAWPGLSPRGADRQRGRAAHRHRALCASCRESRSHGPPRHRREPAGGGRCGRIAPAASTG
eukprot:ctg_1944.g462